MIPRRTIGTIGTIGTIFAIVLTPPLALNAKPPAPAPAASPSLPIETFTLDNGLKVILHEDHRVPKVAVVTWFRVGSKDERKGRTGFAHLFEHLMFKGSAHVPDGKLDLLLEAAGGYSNAGTSADATVYHNVAASNFLEMALWLDADRLAGLTETLTQAKLDNQRGVVRNERRQNYENRPYGKAWLLLSRELWPKNHGYHWPVIGYHKDLLAASTDDVAKFFRRFYVTNNATMVIAGDFDKADAKKWVKKYFGWIPKGKLPDRPSYPKAPPLRKEKRLVETDDVQVPRVYVVWRGPRAYSKNSAAFDVVASILANSKSSRLYKRLVYEDRIAQDIEAAYEGQELGGQFYIVATAKPGVSGDKLLRAIDQELVRLGHTAPSSEELQRAKNSHEAWKLKSLESVLGRALKLAAYSVEAKDAGFFAKDLERYRNVTAASVQRLVKEHLQPHCRIVLVINPNKAKKGGK